MAMGICRAVYVCDKNGEVRDPPLLPTDDDAVDMFYGMNTALPSPPQDQLDLKRDIERIRYALARLFMTADRPTPKFRPYYVQLLNLARLGLVGDAAAPELARRALENVTAELIDNEGAAVKNGHIARLAKTALALSVPCLVAYVLLRLGARQSQMLLLMDRLSVDPAELSSFMLLWIGCFVGVALSYGTRTTTMTLDCLIVTDADRLLPITRHLFAGTLTMILGIMLSLGIFEIKVAGISSRELMSNAMIAFLIGTLCGVSELLLPGAVVKRAGDLLGMK
jgi:hypothetical protein